MGDTSKGLPRMMLGFVVRRCTLYLGHAPDAVEFASWANNYGANESRWCLFGRPISESEARIILKHQARLVSARSAAPHEQFVAEDEFAALTSSRAGACSQTAEQASTPLNPPLARGEEKRGAARGKVVCLDEVRARLLQLHKPGRNGSREL
jgi:hypothetical protein